MGLIKTPKGVDFIIQSPPLTDKERIEISDFIKKSKDKNKKRIQESNAAKELAEK